MPWPKLWSSSKQEQEQENPASGPLQHIQNTTREVADKVKERVHDATADKSLTSTSFLHGFAQPQTVLATAVLTAGCLGCYKLYRTYLRRIPEATNIHQSYFRKRSIFGRVTSVGDGDNFRIYHTPGGRLAGWGWLPWRMIPKDKKMLKNNTIHVRIAGIDAPELAHFGRPAQPYSQEALDWLTSYLIGRRVRAYVHKPDQYSRVVATVYIWKGLLRRDIGLQMLKAGFATVYEAKTGAEFGEGLEQKYRDTERWARSKRKGMWAGDMKSYESPREYKSRYAGEKGDKK